MLVELTEANSQEKLIRVAFSQKMKCTNDRMSWIGCEIPRDDKVRFTWLFHDWLPDDVTEQLEHSDYCKWNGESTKLLDAEVCDIRARGYLWQIIYPGGVCWRSEEHYDAADVEIHESSILPVAELRNIAGVPGSIENPE
jgi:hypothetical protein